MKRKAIGLLSGGLDSTIAVKLIMEQGIDVHLLNFVTPFCTCARNGCSHTARYVANRLQLELKVSIAREEYIKIIKNPRYGYGRNMNPCIDCRIFMFSRAREFMNEIDASFIFTGEVLGQRPMSQYRRVMCIIEQESGLKGLVLRPLSAGLLDPTVPEIEGMVDRDRLLAIKGRSRKSQIKIAKRFGMNDYPCPAGGCRLTDPNFARRLNEAFSHKEDSLTEINLLRYGRHFRLPSGAKVIVGRNEKENRILCDIAKSTEIIVMETEDYAGPITLLCNYRNNRDILFAANLCLTYSDYKGNGRVSVKINNKFKICATRMLPAEIDILRIQ